MRRPTRFATRVSALCALAAIAAALAQACGAFSGSGGDSSSPPDSNDAAADGTTTIESDGSVQDGNGPTHADAGVDDASLDGARTLTDFCGDSGHWICDDFDHDGALGLPNWTSELVDPDASLAIVEPVSPPPSAPSALSSISPDNEQALLFNSMGVTSGGLRCNLWFRIDQEGTGEALLLVLSIYAANGDNYHLDVAAGPDYIREYGHSNSVNLSPHTVSQTFPTGAWTQITLEATVGSGGHASAAIGGVDAGVQSQFDLTAFATPSSISTQVGAYVYPGTGSWSVLYDNVVCDPIP